LRGARALLCAALLSDQRDHLLFTQRVQLLLKLICVEALKVSLRQARRRAHPARSLNARAERGARGRRLRRLVRLLMRRDVWVKVIVVLVIKREGGLQRRDVQALTRDV
jgi:hypothetical protein